MAVMKIVHLALDLLVMFNSILFIERPSSLWSSTDSNDSSVFNRTSFPNDFIFGTASASYQFEGAYKEDGRGPSIWDTYTHKYPERITDASNGDVATDHYHRYKEDVAIMKDMGMDAYRFSISWSRILPNGKLSGGVNEKGIQFYNNLIDELLSKGLRPFVTLFHWDLPQHLEDEYGGFLSSEIVPDFQDFAELCYKEFAAVKVYKEKYQADQKGKIGITLVSHWAVPFSNSKADKDAAQRSIDFAFGWFMHPITYGKLTAERNGMDEINDSTLSLEEALTDNMRIDYHRNHLSYALMAMKLGVDLRGYFA
ncbi:Beta-glucosidase, partial [Thalictrum thalictroides]